MRTCHKTLFVVGAAVTVLAGVVGCGVPRVQGAAADSTPPTASDALPPFDAKVRPVTAGQLGPSWRAKCPVPPAQLRLIELNHVGMDGQSHVGQIIVNQDRVSQTIEVFGELYRMRYPIEKMRTVEHYPNADDELSMEDNNTSAFNCRDIPGTGQWSNHATGRAIDINPLINPYVERSGTFQPKNAQKYLDRSRHDPGLLHHGDPAVRVFTDRGWTWGGDWTSPTDYQHFELP